MTRIGSVLLLIFLSISATAMDVPVVPCGWYCSQKRLDMAECIGEGTFRRIGSMATCKEVYDCMWDGTGGSILCQSYCDGPFCYDV